MGSAASCKNVTRSKASLSVTGFGRSHLRKVFPSPSQGHQVNNNSRSKPSKSNKDGEIRNADQTSNSSLLRDHSPSITYEELSADSKRRRFKEQLNCSVCLENFSNNQGKKSSEQLTKPSSCCQRCSRRSGSSRGASGDNFELAHNVPRVNVIQASLERAPSSRSLQQLQAHWAGESTATSDEGKLDEGQRCDKGDQRLSVALDDDKENLVLPFKNNDIQLASSEENSSDDEASCMHKGKEILQHEDPVDTERGPKRQRDHFASERDTGNNITDDSEDENAKVSDCSAGIMAVRRPSLTSGPIQSNTLVNDDYKIVLESLKSHLFGSLPSLEINGPHGEGNIQQETNDSDVDTKQQQAPHGEPIDEDVSQAALNASPWESQSTSFCTETEIDEMAKSLEEDQVDGAFQRNNGGKASVPSLTRFNSLAVDDGNQLLRRPADGQCASSDCGPLCQRYCHGQSDPFGGLDVDVMKLMDTLDKLSVVLAAKERELAARTKLEQAAEKEKQLSRWKKLGISIKKVKNGKRLIILKVGLSQYHIEGVQFSILLDEEDDLSEVQPDAVPDEVRQWLATTFTKNNATQRKRSEDKPKFRSVANAIRAGIMVDRIYRSLCTPATIQMPSNITNILKGVDSWSFDVFALGDVAGDQVLKYIGYELLNRYGLVHKFKIPQANLDNFLVQMDLGYTKHRNPYHNNLHAADVTQTVHYILCHLGLASWLSDLEIFATIIAAIIHDFQHTGTTNNFHVMSGSETAILYNDRAVLENLHISAAFKVILQDDSNILKNLSKEEYREFRNLVIEMVLATDMSSHFFQLKTMKSLISHSSELNVDKAKALSLILHCCDISHPSKQYDIHSKWTSLLIEEFFRQGDKEKALGLPYSPLCDRNTTLVAESQIGFIDFIVAPSMEVCGDLLDKVYLHTLSENRKALSDTPPPTSGPSRTRPKSLSSVKSSRVMSVDSAADSAALATR
ncbi:Calcium/calmodulin-dependent 3',5'-cyclic nucleotide phosphodiesterase 1C [Halotydeus destructor]|nr:Calcium/calmodulin-dependent 3',5'-cyclic nucleotide phosphodiesterase 1C [Halotydeus destructor]